MSSNKGIQLKNLTRGAESEAVESWEVPMVCETDLLEGRRGDTCTLFPEEDRSELTGPQAEKLRAFWSDRIERLEGNRRADGPFPGDVLEFQALARNRVRIMDRIIKRAEGCPEEVEVPASLQRFWEKHAPAGWRLRICTEATKGVSVTVLGRCLHETKEILVLAGDSEDEMLATLAHEVAHALCDKDEDHSARWARKALELGDSLKTVLTHSDCDQKDTEWVELATELNAKHRGRVVVTGCAENNNFFGDWNEDCECRRAWRCDACREEHLAKEAS